MKSGSRHRAMEREALAPADGRVLSEGQNSRLRQRSPYRLLVVLLFLAVAVVVWGTRYKVSLYHSQPHHALQGTVAKLWLGPRAASSVLLYRGPHQEIDVCPFTLLMLHLPEQASPLGLFADAALLLVIFPPLRSLRAPPSSQLL
jgi:hypothetical protein